jgi:hypothetical protein
MGMERRYSAKRVAAIAMGSSLFVWVTISAMALPQLVGVNWHHSTRMWFYLSPLAVLITASIQTYRASKAFKRGVDQDLWDKKAIERLRETLEQPLWTSLAALLAGSAFLFVLIDIVVSIPGKHHFAGYGGFLLLWISPFTTLGALRATLRPKPSVGRIWGRGQAVWVGEMKPIVSEHWGRR